MPRTFYRRQLPHLQRDSKSHFLTFCTHQHWVLPEQVRFIVLNSCLHEHDKSMDLYIAVVMPDHVHLIFTPLIDNQKREVCSLAQIMNAIKGASAHKINKALHRSGGYGMWCAHRRVWIQRCSTCLKIRSANVWRIAGKNTPGYGRRPRRIPTLRNEHLEKSVFC